MFDYEVSLTVSAATPDTQDVERHILEVLACAGVDVVPESILARDAHTEALEVAAQRVEP